MGDEQDKEFDIIFKAADSEHNRQIKAKELHFKQTESFALLSLRAPALVSAGGIAAALGFFSANYQTIKGDQQSIYYFSFVLLCLFLSLFITLISSGLAYFSQVLISAALNSIEYTYVHPYYSNGRFHSYYVLAGTLFIVLTWISVAASIFFVAIGGVMFLRLLHHMI